MILGDGGMLSLITGIIPMNAIIRADRLFIRSPRSLDWKKIAKLNIPRITSGTSTVVKGTQGNLYNGTWKWAWP